MKLDIIKLGSVWALSALLCACETVIKVPEITGGNPEDAVVETAFTYGPFVNVKMDVKQAIDAAGKRCIEWGYDAAEPFGGVKHACIQTADHFSGCLTNQITTSFQCVYKD